MTSASFLFERAPVVVIGTAPWSAPWLTEQNLAFALAARHPVLYVEPPQITPRRTGSDGLRRLRRERVHGREVIVFRPVVLPLRSRERSAKLSAPLYRSQVRGVVSRLGFQGALMLAGDARPGIVGAAGERVSSYIVKDWLYDDGSLLGRPVAELIRERDDICGRVDVVLAISASLQESLAGAGIHARLLRHGFHADLAAAYEHRPPPEYDQIPGPRLVFAGRVDGRLDVGKLRAVADRVPGASIVIIGPTSPRMSSSDLELLTSAPNIHLLGARARDALPPYLAHADCLLIPYRDTVWAHHGSPLKLWDYLYAGPPIVGSGYTVLADYADFVGFSNDDDDFVAHVNAALGDGRDAGCAQRRRFALQNTWDVRSVELESILSAAADAPRHQTSEPSWVLT